MRAADLAALLALAGFVGAQTCSSERASVDASGAEADHGSGFPALTPDGRRVAFVSGATNLVPGDTNQRDDVFVRDLVLGTIERVSVATGGAEGDGACGYPALSADGRFVAFQSTSANLVPGDANGGVDVFVRDRLTGATECVSVGAGGAPGDGPSFAPTITPDGRYVVFASFADDLVPGDANGTRDVFLRDRLAGVTELVSVASTGAQGDDMSGGNLLLAFATPDGRFVLFGSAAANLVPGDTNGATEPFVRDRLLGTTRRLVLGQGGAQPDGDVDVSSLSPDGRWVGLMAAATNLVPGDANAQADAFVLDRASGALERVSVDSQGAEADGASFGVSVSLDGRFALFTSLATNLVPGDTNDRRDVFRRDRWAGTTERFVLSASGAQPDADCHSLSVSATGEVLAFASASNGIVVNDTNGATDVFVRACRPATAYCFGDGSGAPCPCGNAGAWDAGCANSAGSGAALAAEGEARTGADTLTLVARGVPPGASTLFFEGTAPLATPAAFGDGLRCIGGTIQRLGIQPAAGGSAAWGFGVPGAPLLSVQGGIPAGGDYREYQAWYRNAAPFCTAAPFNLSNALGVVWGP